MNILSVENLSKSYADKLLIEKISFGIASGEKVALIARNGTGKTTLLKILAGIDIQDSGEYTYRKDIRVDYLQQDPPMDPSQTVSEVIFDRSNPILELLSDYEKVLEKLEGQPSEELNSELQRLSSRIDDADAWDYEVRVRQVLSKLRIRNLEQPVGQLSGGQKKRIALARTLIDPVDLIMLDEPTNHLDVEMVEWLEEYLIRSKLAVLLVTHDRYFLDNITNRIIELDNGNLYEYDGNYSYFLQKKAEREQNEASELDKSRNLMRKELEWMRRMPKARGTKSKARIDSFYKLKEKTSGRRKQDELSLDIKMNRIGGKVIEMKKVYKSYGELPILKGFDYTFRTGERVGIVGRNGAGKTTFLDLLTGDVSPDSGKINTGETIVFGYYSQQGLDLKEDKRVIDVVKDFADVIQLSDGSKVSASQFLKLFQFPPEMHYTYFSKLSGGEKRRLYLLTVLVKNPNFLILDEPTNDLDLITLSTLEEFLLNYKGCLVLVSHDRYFMDKLVDHLLIFEGNGTIRDFNGSYSEYRIEQTENEKALKERSAQKKEQKVVESKPSRRKLSYKERLEFERLEGEIEELESEKKILAEKLSSGSLDHQEATDLSLRVQQVIDLIDEKSMRWLELSEI
jgi:ATP-binding cassette subfamily F protein uup